MKYTIIDENVETARGRLKGLLRDLTEEPNDDESDDENIENEETKYDNKNDVPKRGRPPKKIKQEINPQTYITKLFDRSVDLTCYNENSPLYPICREWIYDKPDRKIKFKKLKSAPSRKEHVTLLEKIQNGDITEINDLPAIKTNDITRIPELTAEQKSVDKEKIKLDYDLENAPANKADLLLEHKQRWGKVKKQWINQSRIYEEKFKASFRILDEIGFK